MPARYADSPAGRRLRQASCMAAARSFAAARGSSAASTLRMTATPDAPAAMTSAALAGVMPPMPIRGKSQRAAMSRSRDGPAGRFPRMGRGSEHGAYHQEVGPVGNGAAGSFCRMDGTAHLRAGRKQGRSCGYRQGFLAQLYAIGAGGGGDIDALVDEEGGAAVDGLLQFAGEGQEPTAGHLLGAELDEGDATVDGGCYAAG